MKNILILGAGQSTSHLIKYLLEYANKNNSTVTVCDKNVELAKERINGHACGRAIEFDVNNEQLRKEQIGNADIVINFLAPIFQYLIALDCLSYGKNCVTASYEDIRIRDLNDDAKKKGILILNEMGLDPGIDHMSAMSLIADIRNNGGYVTEFLSYGSGLPAPEVQSNPLRYAITWNPRNIVMAGFSGAQYMENSQLKIVSHGHLFQRTWRVDVDGVGTLEAYPNRDSLVYKDLFNLEKVKTMIRGTLRYPGWSETWLQIIKLGIPNEVLKIPRLNEMTYAEFTELFLPLNSNGTKLETRVANYLGINPTGKIMDNLKWLGLFSKDKIKGNPKTSTEVMTDLLNEKMPLPEGERDMVILQHEIEAEYPGENRKEKIISTLVEYGETEVFTAISKTVGIPAAIAAKLILNGEITETGTHIPTKPEIYSKVLKELEEIGIKFKDKREDIL
ncbi:MAG: saccharopine dehydrogenase C-terminal domain-containing protein [Ignavibacteria bacterium]|jgi:saccharopine dehydrogenase (NADP+, L-glutamate forming)